jgi:hypothetical protein
MIPMSDSDNGGIGTNSLSLETSGHISARLCGGWTAILRGIVAEQSDHYVNAIHRSRASDCPPNVGAIGRRFREFVYAF